MCPAVLGHGCQHCQARGAVLRGEPSPDKGEDEGEDAGEGQDEAEGTCEGFGRGGQFW